jgi:hypothetical protein
MSKHFSCSALLAATIALASVSAADAADLVGRAVLPASTFAPGPTSGQFTGPANGVTPPYVNQQPVQGFSGILYGPRPGTFVVLVDNGFGGRGNSADAVLRAYALKPDFKTRFGGTGQVLPINFATGNVAPSFDATTFLSFNDAGRLVGFPITAEQATYYPNSTIPVDPTIQSGRLLTGADFDPESIRKLADGTYWVGDEFGPFLLHFSATGQLIDPPVQLPNFRALGTNPLVQAAENLLLSGEVNARTSRGFEGLALNASGTKLYALLEGALIPDTRQVRLLINEFDVATKTYTGRTFAYRLDVTTPSGQAIGDFSAINDHEFLVIERDGQQGDPNNPAFTNPARLKRIYKIDINQIDQFGYVKKELVVDLLKIHDPYNLGGNGTTDGIFTFPFVTIESVLPVAPDILLVTNDNNFPGSVGRTPGVPDDNEFILVKLDQPLALDPRVLLRR